MKRGSEFAKELSHAMQERADLEAGYAKGLAKLSAKLFKSAREQSGTVSNAWHFIAEDMESTAATHRTVAAALAEEVAKPLK